MKIFKNIFWSIISPANLFRAWEEFKHGKRNKADVMEFERELENNIFTLYRDLRSGAYKHGSYTGFWIHDPKRRRIHKAVVRDRVLHHAVFWVLNPIFEPTFVPTSFSCRVGKGAHRGVDFLAEAIRKVSRNYTRQCFVLKCDVRRFFDSVDQATLLEILERRIKDEKARWLLREIVGSYSSAVCERERERERESTQHLAPNGIPIGNLTSQLFANVYMNEFDQFVKHTLKVEYYARYTDDFVIVSEDHKLLERLLPRIHDCLGIQLKLSLHPDKISIQRFLRGVDFLGQIVFPRYRLLRAKTRKRIFRKMREKVKQYKSGLVTKESLHQSLQSYLGVLSHTNSHEVSEKLKNQCWFWLTE